MGLSPHQSSTRRRLAPSRPGGASDLAERVIASRSARTQQMAERSVAMSGYADGTTMPCRIDPADPNVFAFGEKPFM